MAMERAVMETGRIDPIDAETVRAAQMTVVRYVPNLDDCRTILKALGIYEEV